MNPYDKARIEGLTKMEYERALDGVKRVSGGVCVCGHWDAVHRKGGTRTCEGMRCGCYTFRQLTAGNCGVGTKTPKCPKCGAVVVGQEVSKSPRGMELIIEWKHLKGDSCKTVEAIMLDDAGEYEYNMMDEPVGVKKAAKMTPAEIKAVLDKVAPMPKPVELTGRAPRAREGEEV